MMNDKEFRPEPFTSEEHFRKIYEDYLERDRESAPPSVMEAYQAMRKSFEDYLSEYSRDEFRHAYQCGYEAGIKAATVNQL